MKNRQVSTELVRDFVIFRGGKLSKNWQYNNFINTSKGVTSKDLVQDFKKDFQDAA